MPLTPNEKKALAVLKKELQRNYRLIDARLFGSKASGADSPDSDMDVSITLENLTPAIESDIDDLIFEINLKHDCFITALFFSQAELEKGPLSESPVYKKIVREGIAL